MTVAIKANLRKLLVFNLLSLADFFLTWHLLRRGGGQVYESNPVASAWLSSYGWVGLLIFKVAMVLLIGAIAVVISLHRPRTSGRILMFACLVTGGVVAYSLFLSGALPAPPASEPPAPWSMPRGRTALKGPYHVLPIAPGERRPLPQGLPRAFPGGFVAAGWAGQEFGPVQAGLIAGACLEGTAVGCRAPALTALAVQLAPVQVASFGASRARAWCPVFSAQWLP